MGRFVCVVCNHLPTRQCALVYILMLAFGSAVVSPQLRVQSKPSLILLSRSFSLPGKFSFLSCHSQFVSGATSLYLRPPFIFTSHTSISASY